jgi:phospholipase/lecithinase/hemolysin
MTKLVSRQSEGLRRWGAVLLAATCLCAPARAGSLYVFGDSLADDGNTPKFGIPYPPAPYSDFRFSNGPVFSQYLGPLTGLNVSPANNYAVGGAFAGPLSILGKTYNNLENLPPALGEPGFPVPLPSFLSEVTEFQATGTHFSASDVVAVWVGANDYFATLGLVNAGLANATTALTAAITTVATQTATGVSELNALGAQRFVVFNLPPLGVTPEFNQDGAAVVGETDLISAEHAQLDRGEHHRRECRAIVQRAARRPRRLWQDQHHAGLHRCRRLCDRADRGAEPVCVLGRGAPHHRHARDHCAICGG